MAAITTPAPAAPVPMIHRIRRSSPSSVAARSRRYGSPPPPLTRCNMMCHSLQRFYREDLDRRASEVRCYIDDRGNGACSGDVAGRVQVRRRGGLSGFADADRGRRTCPKFESVPEVDGRSMLTIYSAAPLLKRRSVILPTTSRGRLIRRLQGKPMRLFARRNSFRAPGIIGFRSGNAGPYQPVGIDVTALKRLNRILEAASFDAFDERTFLRLAPPASPPDHSGLLGRAVA